MLLRQVPRMGEVCPTPHSSKWDSNRRSREGRPPPPWPLTLLPPCISVSFIPPERCRGPQENSGRIGGVEKGEFERHSASKEVAAQICVRRADTVQLRAQEIDEPTKIRIVVQSDPLRVYEVVRQRLRRTRGPIEIQPFGHHEDRKRGRIAACIRRFAHDRLEAYGRLRIAIGCAPGLANAERFNRRKEIGVFLGRHHADEATKAEPSCERVGAGKRRTEQNQKLS